jgi:SAM-dependent methyltransferase
VESEIDFVDETFTNLRGRTARFLREDFCGTLNTSCEWVRRRKGNIAVGIDLDPTPLAWGRTHQLMALTPEQRARVHVHQGDVLEHVPVEELVPAAQREGGGGIPAFPRFDAVLAMNFSYWCFKKRDVLLRYLRGVHDSLADDGVLFMDFYGGSDALKEMRERRKVPRVRRGEEGYREGGHNGPYTYIWEQETYDPITGDLVCHIHFRFPDGSSLRNAFSYHWRLWTLPELRDLLTEAGFARSTVYWEGDDGKGGGDGVFTARERGEACPSYVCYVSAER